MCFSGEVYQCYIAVNSFALTHQLWTREQELEHGNFGPSSKAPVQYHQKMLNWQNGNKVRGKGSGLHRMRGSLGGVSTGGAWAP